jgi:hypothetical protein
MRALPDAADFGSAVDGLVVSCGTPTLPALRGAHSYAASVASQKPNDKIAVVLVTDGEPDACASTITNVSSEAAAHAPRIPTYVIGLGSSLSNLNAIAVAGGTQQAILVSTNNPAQTSVDLQKALEKIRGVAAACSFQLPKPPDGKALDVNAVNVVFTPPGGAPQTVPYDTACSGGTGWHYDNSAAPTEIELCASSCAAVKANADGKVNIAFGCATQVK